MKNKLFWYGKFNLYFVTTDQVFYCYQFNPYPATGLFPYNLKTSENQMFLNACIWCRERPVAWSGLQSATYNFLDQTQITLKFLVLIYEFFIFFDSPKFNLKRSWLYTEMILRSSIHFNFEENNLHLVPTLSDCVFSF